MRATVKLTRYRRMNWWQRVRVWFWLRRVEKQINAHLAIKEVELSTHVNDLASRGVATLAEERTDD